MPVVTKLEARKLILLEEILKFDEYHRNGEGKKNWHFEGRIYGLCIIVNWNMCRTWWEKKSQPHTIITMKEYIRFKQQRNNRPSIKTLTEYLRLKQNGSKD